MSKRAKKSSDADEALAYWYRWEFLRRNVDYQSDFAAFELLSEHWCARNDDLYHSIYAKTEVDWKFFCVTIAPEMLRICKKWAITRPVPPTWNFTKEFGFLKSTESRMRIVCLPFSADKRAWRIWDIKYEEPPKSSEEVRSRVRKHLAWMQGVVDGRPHGPFGPGHLWMHFDLDMPISFLREQFEQRLGEAIGEYEARKPPKMRKRFPDFVLQLKAWDLQIRGLTVPQIAESMYRSEYVTYRKRGIPPSEDASFKKVRHHLRRAKQFINGGYKQIE